MGRFTLAAKHHQTIAEILEADGNLAKSIHHYEQAADYFKGEESNASANKCLLKVAFHAAETEDYMKAIKIYEEVCGTRGVVFADLLIHVSNRSYYDLNLCKLM